MTMHRTFATRVLVVGEKEEVVEVATLGKAVVEGCVAPPPTIAGAPTAMLRDLIWWIESEKAYQGSGLLMRKRR